MNPNDSRPSSVNGENEVILQNQSQLSNAPTPSINEWTKIPVKEAPANDEGSEHSAPGSSLPLSNLTPF